MNISHILKNPYGNIFSLFFFLISEFSKQAICLNNNFSHSIYPHCQLTILNPISYLIKRNLYFPKQLNRLQLWFQPVNCEGKSHEHGKSYMKENLMKSPLDEAVWLFCFNSPQIQGLFLKAWHQHSKLHSAFIGPFKYHVSLIIIKYL